MPRRNRNNKKNEGDYGSPAWMTTYGDMVTLLLTFFVLLYSFSAVDLERFSEVMSAIQHSFLGRTGILMGTIEVGDAEGRKIDVAESAVDAEIISEQEAAILEMMAELEETYEEVRAFLLAAGLEEDVMLRMEERGIVMELPEKILFDTGRAELKADFLPTLELLAELLAGLRNQVIVEGHTDDVPIQTFFYPSNWELSVARAVSVARYLVEKHDLEPERFLATGYGEYHPIDSNETPEGRARNRRVNIVISIKQIKE